MADRKKLVAGNWKMNGLCAAGAALAGELARRAAAAGGGLGCDLLVCPPATLLSAVHAALAGSAVALGGQDCHAERQGAHQDRTVRPRRWRDIVEPSRIRHAWQHRDCAHDLIRMVVAPRTNRRRCPGG